MSHTNFRLSFLSRPHFLRQVTVLPAIPDGLTPFLSLLGEGWRIGEFLELPESGSKSNLLLRPKIGPKDAMCCGGIWNT